MKSDGFPVDIPFASLLGLKLVSFGNDASELSLELKPELMNSWQVAHGGVLMTVLDVAMAFAGRSQDPAVTGNVTVEMKTSFMRPGVGFLTARGRCIHRTVTLVFCEAQIVDAHDQVVAQASGTFKYLRRVDRDRLKSRAQLGPVIHHKGESDDNQ